MSDPDLDERYPDTRDASEASTASLVSDLSDTALWQQAREACARFYLERDERPIDLTKPNSPLDDYTLHAERPSKHSLVVFAQGKKTARACAHLQFKAELELGDAPIIFRTRDPVRLDIALVLMSFIALATGRSVQFFVGILCEEYTVSAEGVISFTPIEPTEEDH